jgi:hypothetical protein
MNLYLIPTSHLRTVFSVYIPADGYAAGSSKKPKKDWTLYKEAWHWLTARQRNADPAQRIRI